MASFKPLAAIFCLSGLIWQVSPSHSSDMGVAGLIDMPSARMRADGALTTSVNNAKIACLFIISPIRVRLGLK